ncbi:MAG: HlyD family efflux transporter periplasmic adaptor subunit [Pseudomonadota bacterium]
MALLLGLSSFTLNYSCKKSESSPSKAEGPVVVQTFKVVKKPIEDQLVISGSLTANSILDLPSFGEGIITECFVKIGSVVKSGDKLCRIKNDNPGETFLPYEVEAPVGGTIAQFYVGPGERVAKGSKLLSLVTSKDVKISLEATAEQMKPLKVGAVGTWAPLDQADPAAAFPVVVRSMAPIADPISKTYKIELAPKASSKGGESPLGKATFKLNSEIGIEIPEKATTYIGDVPQVRVLIDSKVKYVPITLGRTNFDRIQVKAGLVGGEEIVVYTPKYLPEGETVVVKAETNAKK